MSQFERLAMAMADGDGEQQEEQEQQALLADGLALSNRYRARPVLRQTMHRAHFEHHLRTYLKRHGVFYFSDLSLETLAYHPDLMATMEQALVKHQAKLVHFSIGGMDFLVQHASPTTRKALLQLTTDVGRILGRVAFLKTISIAFGTGARFPFARTILQALASCHYTQVVEFDLKPGMADYSCLTDYLRNHGSLEQVFLRDVDDKVMEHLGDALLSMRKLDRVSLRGSRSSPLTLEKENISLSKILSLPTLKSFEMIEASFINESAASAFIKGLDQSKITDLVLVRVNVPESMMLHMAATLAKMGLERVGTSAGSQQVMEALGMALPKPKSIHTLVLHPDSPMRESDSTLLVPLLADTSFWKVTNVDLSVSNWPHEFDEALSNVIASNSYLTSLDIRFPYNYTGPATASKRFIAAVDSGSRCLTRVTVHQDFRDISHIWGCDLEPVLELNRQRETHGHLFASIARASTMQNRCWHVMRATEAVDMTTLFEFIRRNEWELQMLIQSLTATSC